MTFDEFVYRRIGEAPDEDQAQHLNKVSLAILEACKMSPSDQEAQLCYVAKKLDKHGKLMVQKLAEFVRLHEEAQ
jgi:hypothetical protein